MKGDDVEEVLAIEQASFPTPWSRLAFLSELLENERAVYLVAREEGRIIGYVGMWRILEEGHITNLAVHPDARRRGVGRRLLQTLCDLAQARGLHRLTLEVRVSNATAQRLYESFGFQAAGVRPGYYQDNNEDALIMWLDLPEPARDEERRPAHSRPGSGR
ncbi:MAG TPA: ribosomal protein S18-alanine N-acetyltransferase [Firmicutes bacterium]|nr:ribosomal protein S18-alanine N-acetyltransferase [Bacillota bacterium]